jgi:CheY-like chemotaxis protein
MTLVLIVDDNPAMRHLLQMALELEDEHYQLAEASTGKEALELLHATPEPTVVVLDYRLPDMNGVTLLEQLVTQDVGRAAQRPRRFFLCSALDPATLKAYCAPLRRRVPIQLFAKPFRMDTLLAAIQRAAQELEATGTPAERPTGARSRRRQAEPATERRQQQAG